MSSVDNSVDFAQLRATAPPPLRHSNSFKKNRRGEYDAAELLKHSYNSTPPPLSGRCCGIYDPCCCTIPSGYLEACLPDDATHNMKMACCSCKCIFEYFVAELCCLWSCGRACYQGYRVRQYIKALVPPEDDNGDRSAASGPPTASMSDNKAAVIPASTNGHTDSVDL